MDRAKQGGRYAASVRRARANARHWGLEVKPLTSTGENRSHPAWCVCRDCLRAGGSTCVG